MEPEISTDSTSSSQNDVKFRSIEVRAVIAIDFGTTHTLFAYATTKNPGKLYLPRPSSTTSNASFGMSLASSAASASSPDSTPAYVDAKQPCCALFDKKLNLLKYGYEAQDHFLRIQFSEKVSSSFIQQKSANINEVYYYFEGVKMKIFERDRHGLPVSTRVSCRTVGGVHSVPLQEVITRIFMHIKNEALEHLMSTCPKEDLGPDFEVAKHVKWVLTVPALWREEEKQFMRRCASCANMIDEIQSPYLMIALEPECCAIAIQSKELPLDNPGDKILCIDAGGGTVDMCVLKVDTGSSSNRVRLKQIVGSSGGCWGSQNIDTKFRSWLATFCGGEAILDKIFAEEPSVEIGVMKLWEILKCSLSPSELLETDYKKRKELDLAILTPYLDRSLSNLAERWNASKDYKSLARHYKKPETTPDYRIKVLREGMLLRSETHSILLPPALLLSFFEPVISSITKHVRKILDDNNDILYDLKHIILVGGFSSCSYLRKMMKDEFSSRVGEIVYSPKASVMTVIGGVKYGLQPGIISSRISMQTIGMKAVVKYDAKKHHGPIWEDHKIKDPSTGEKLIRDVFIPFVRINDSVEESSQIVHRFKPRPEAKDVKVELFACELPTVPLLVSDPGCNKLLTILVDLDESHTSNDVFEAQMHFGSSELMIVILDVKQKKTTKYNLRYAKEVNELINLP